MGKMKKKRAAPAPFPRYSMECKGGRYAARSWLGLGWAILARRTANLVRTLKWSDR